jgi:hypothetical protein
MAWRNNLKLTPRTLRRRVLVCFQEKWPMLEAKLFYGEPGILDLQDRLSGQVLYGYKMGGKMIFLYVSKSVRAAPRAVYQRMREMEAAGCLVGIVCQLGDAWDIVVDDPINYKRKKRTFLYREQEEPKNDESEE